MRPNYRAYYDKKMWYVANFDLWGDPNQATCDLAQHDEELFNIYLSEVELMQFTGLYDKYGKEIYEGDIVHWEDCGLIDDEMVYEDTFVIYWSDVFFTWKAKNKDANVIDLYDISDNRELEIIGNIYENPEWVANLIDDEE